MKKPISVRPHGFTLVELLVVIAIIAVLAAAGFQAGTYALNKAKQTKALGVCTEMEQAVQRFVDDNGTLPIDIDADTEFTSNSAEGMELLRVLLNMETESPIRNGKGIKYLNVKQGKQTGPDGIDGLVYNETGETLLGLYDPWGGDYTIVLDGDYDEQLSVKPKAASTAKALNGRKVAVWCDGPDGAESDTVGNAKDDVTTW